MDTIEELTQYFNNAYGIDKEWPTTFEVSATLYGRVCQYVFTNCIRKGAFQKTDLGYWLRSVSVGESGGIMYKNVELLIKKD